MNDHILDSLPLGFIFLASFVMMVGMLEIGFQVAQRSTAKRPKAQVAQVRALMGATLGLLAFMLAFTFSGSQQHFENRTQMQIEESILLKNAFLQTDYLIEPARSEARNLLLEYVEGRIEFKAMAEARETEQVNKLLKRAIDIQQQLWELGTDDLQYESDVFAQSVLGMVEMQSRRINAVVANRAPLIIWVTLFFTAAVAMLVVGYQAGLTGARSPLATLSLAIAFSAVTILIIDLDRPFQSLFEIDVSVMQVLADFMRASIAGTG